MERKHKVYNKKQTYFAISLHALVYNNLTIIHLK